MKFFEENFENFIKFSKTPEKFKNLNRLGR